MNEVTTFKWIDKNGAPHFPAEMDTKHLFNTIVMIWNHTAPESLRMSSYKHYYFNPEVYSVQYLIDAVKYLYTEFKKRHDISPFMFSTIREIEKKMSEYMEAQIQKIEE